MQAKKGFFEKLSWLLQRALQMLRLMLNSVTGCLIMLHPCCDGARKRSLLCGDQLFFGLSRISAFDFCYLIKDKIFVIRDF